MLGLWHAFAVPIHTGQSSRRGVVAKVARVIGALALAALMGSAMADRRGWVLGLLVFLIYGSLLAVTALSFGRLRRWSARHVVLDALAFIPLTFFALLLIPVLPWWGAALISLAAGMIFVPFAVRRRTAQQRSAPGTQLSSVRVEPE
jgi:uncharacterized membrane protein (DUF2068 family)